ncbi:ATPase [Mycobacterium tuberculosis variant bovis]|nr:ATPase [Mycobacterium tuberculosis]PHP00568.1 ATPase [Mycobacterium tuberculosis variant bovis]
MTVMADRSGRPAPVRRQMKTLTQAALLRLFCHLVQLLQDLPDPFWYRLDLSSDSVDLSWHLGLEDGLDHLEGTLHSLDDLAKRLIVLVEPVEAIVDRIDYIVSLGETVMSPLSVTEHAVRGVLDRLRNRTVHEPTN